VQRLFSTFADGWPGGGFFTQRLLLGATLLYSCVGCLSAKPVCGTLVPQSIGALAGILLVAGLWTPVAGVLAAIVEAWIAFSIQNGPRFSGHPRSPRRNPGDDRPWRLVVGRLALRQKAYRAAGALGLYLKRRNPNSVHQGNLCMILFRVSNATGSRISEGAPAAAM
jgi:hypothetical protein